jgi:hypothetical protein
MNVIERLPLTKIHFLNSLKYSDYKCTVNSKKSDKDQKVLFDNLKRYCNEIIKGKGEFKRTYKHTLNTPLEAGGRLFCGDSIQGFPKAIRGFLFGDSTTDIDMVNAHPKILSFLCHKHNIPCANLDYYIANRDEILSTFSNRDEGKEAFLKAINYDKLNKKIKNKTFIEFDKECKRIQKELVELSIFKDIVSCSSYRDLNFNGSAINRILCHFENKILQVALDTLARKNIELCALMFDGCMIYGTNYGSELIDELTNKINSVFEGLNMRLTYKEHNNDIQLPHDFVSPTTEEEKGDLLKGLTICNNDLEAVNYVYDKLNNRFVFSDGNYWFRNDDYCWTSDKSIIECFLGQYIMNSQIYRIDKDNNPVEYVQNYKASNNIKKALLDKIGSQRNTKNWFNSVIKSSLGKILFNNGFYNFDTAEFLPLDRLDDKIVFFEKCDYDYSTSTDEYTKSIEKRFFTDTLGYDVGNYLLKTLAQGLSGYPVKEFLFGLGSGNTGKSILTKAISNTFGGYFGSYNAVNLAYKNTSQDEAQQLRWVLLLQTKRFLASNEVNSNADLNGNSIKKLSSGGLDDIIARIHGGNETAFTFMALCMLFANDVKNITPKDDALNNRLKVFTYNKVFVEDVENPEFELPMDKNISSEVDTLEFKLGFMNLLMDAYKSIRVIGRVEPISVTRSKEEWFNISKDCTIQELMNDFEITNNPDDFIKSSDLQEWLDGKKMNISMKKLGLEFNKYCSIQQHNNCSTSNVKKINGKTHRVWSGIKLIVEG